MKGLKIFVSLLFLCVTTPIWYYVLYTLLTIAHVDRLIWFLYWIYVPVEIFSTAVLKLIDVAESK